MAVSNAAAFYQTYLDRPKEKFWNSSGVSLKPLKNYKE